MAGGLPWGARARAAACPSVMCWGSEPGVGVPLPGKCQPLVLQSGTAALLQAHSWVSCCNIA